MRRAKHGSPSRRRGPLVERFLVRWRTLSYLHLSWETRKDLEKNEPASSIQKRLTQFHKKVAENGLDSDEEM